MNKIKTKKMVAYNLLKKDRLYKAIRNYNKNNGIKHRGLYKLNKKELIKVFKLHEFHNEIVNEQGFDTNKEIKVQGKTDDLFRFHTNRQQNELYNKERELRLVQFQDELKRSKLVQKLYNVFLNDYNLKIITFKKSGSRRNSFDHKLITKQVNLRNEPIKEFQIEMKTNKNNKKVYPWGDSQLCDVYLKRFFPIDNVTHEYFIKNYLYLFNIFLDNRKNKYFSLKYIDEISYEMYKKHIYTNNAHKKLNFFKVLKELYNTDENFKEEINDFQKKYCSDFLVNFQNDVNLKEMNEFICSKIKCKDFIILFDQTKDDWRVSPMAQEHFKIVKVELQPGKPNKRIGNFYIGYKVYTGKYNFVIRLRWKNGNGILGPAWKIGE